MIILLHSLLPHVHHEDLSDADHTEAHVVAENFIDYLQLIFHTDMGDGHLENFETSQGLDFEISNSIDQDFPAIPTRHNLVEYTEQIFITNDYLLRDDPYPDSPYLTSTCLRGPPHIS